MLYKFRRLIHILARSLVFVKEIILPSLVWIGVHPELHAELVIRLQIAVFDMLRIACLSLKFFDGLQNKSVSERQQRNIKPLTF